MAEFGHTASGDPRQKRCTCLRGATCTPRGRRPQRMLNHIEEHVTTKFGVRAFSRLACSAEKCFFAEVRRAPRGTCHVAPITPRSSPKVVRRAGASIGTTRVRIGPAVSAPRAEMLGHTDRQTHKQPDLYFPERPPCMKSPMSKQC